MFLESCWIVKTKWNLCRNYLKRFRLFWNLHFFSYSNRLNSVLVSFCVLYKISPETMYPNTQTQNLRFDLFGPGGLGWPWLARSHKRFGRVLRSIQDTKDMIHVSPLICFNSIRLLCPEKPATTDSQKSYLWPARYRHQRVSDKIWQTNRKFINGAVNKPGGHAVETTWWGCSYK